MVIHCPKNGLFMVAAFVVGMTSGLFLHKTGVLEEPSHRFHLQRLYTNGTHIINPLMQVEGPAGGDATLESTKHALESYIHKSIKDGDASSISVYLRDLNKGTWIGINENDSFAAASLAKIPILLSFFMKAQNDPSIFSKKIHYEGTEPGLPVYQSIAPQNNLQPGSNYTVEELLRQMIIYSDNIPIVLLSKDTDDTLIEKLLSDLQVPQMRRDSGEYHLSAKNYASYFRVLYSASYLNSDSSEKILHLLAETDFKEGLVAGVPKNIIVAHKFGEREKLADEVEFHDCGIIYFPESPYLICVMTRGWDIDTLKNKIREISKIAYDQKSSG